MLGQHAAPAQLVLPYLIQQACQRPRIGTLAALSGDSGPGPLRLQQAIQELHDLGPSEWWRLGIVNFVHEASWRLILLRHCEGAPSLSERPLELYHAMIYVYP